MSTKQVNLNIEELKTFLKHIIRNNSFLQENGKVPTAVNIEGPAGIGKTSSVEQLCDELGFNLIRLNLATIEELGDLVGFPVRQFQLCKENEGTILKNTEVPEKVMVPTKVKKMVTQNRVVKKQVMEGGSFVMKDINMPIQIETEVEEMVEQVVMKSVSVPAPDIECLWIDEHAIEEYLKQGYKFTGEKRMSYCPPEWIAGLDDKPGILILDDYSRADQRFIQACMTLIETQKYMSWSLPKNWTILLTTNPDNGEYLVTPMDIAQKTRFISVNLKFDVEIWAKWAEKYGIDSRCINFLLLHPEIVTEQCNARSIATFFNALGSIENFEKELPLIQMIGEGSVGPEFSTLFSIFINNKLDKLVSPKDMLLSPNEDEILKKIQDCVGIGNDYRADIASVLTSRIINYSLVYAENNTVMQKTIDRLIKFATEPGIFTDDLKYIIVKKLLNGNKKFQKLMIDKTVMDMAMK